MLTKTLFQTLFAYHGHTHTHLLDLAAQLDEADYKAQTGYGKGSMHDIFFHLVRALNNWRQGMETGKRLYSLNAEDFTTLEAVRAGFQKEQSAWQNLLDSLSAEEIEGDVTLTRGSGKEENIPRWRIMQHLVLHGMQHHAELAHLLTLKGKSPGDIDFIFFK
jgi:uncharacterized damage-inducible protein DinB